MTNRPLASLATRVSAAASTQMADRYEAVRSNSLTLVTPLSDEDCQVQSMPDASPAKWHLAHTTWFFETFILQRYETQHAGFSTAGPALAILPIVALSTLCRRPGMFSTNLY